MQMQTTSRNQSSSTKKKRFASRNTQNIIFRQSNKNHKLNHYAILEITEGQETKHASYVCYTLLRQWGKSYEACSMHRNPPMPHKSSCHRTNCGMTSADCRQSFMLVHKAPSYRNLANAKAMVPWANQHVKRRHVTTSRQSHAVLSKPQSG